MLIPTLVDEQQQQPKKAPYYQQSTDYQVVHGNTITKNVIKLITNERTQKKVNLAA